MFVSREPRINNKTFTAGLLLCLWRFVLER